MLPKIYFSLFLAYLTCAALWPPVSQLCLYMSIFFLVNLYSLCLRSVFQIHEIQDFSQSALFLWVTFTHLTHLRMQSGSILIKNIHFYCLWSFLRFSFETAVTINKTYPAGTNLCEYAAILDLMSTQLLHHIFGSFCYSWFNSQVVDEVSHPQLHRTDHLHRVTWGQREHDSGITSRFESGYSKHHPLRLLSELLNMILARDHIDVSFICFFLKPALFIVIS